MALATECTEKELKILKDQVRALHVSEFRQFMSKNWFYYKQTSTPSFHPQKREFELWFYTTRTYPNVI